MQSLETDMLLVKIDEKHGISITMKDSGDCLSQSDSIYRVNNLHKESDCICYEIEGNDFRGTVRITAERPDELSIKISADPEAGMKEKLNYPPAWKMQSGDTGIYPIGEGYAFPVNDASIKIKNRMVFYSGSASMNLVGFLRKKHCVITALKSGCDAELNNYRDKDGILHCQLQWLSQKGQWGYDRETRIFFAEDLVSAMRKYREWRKSMGWIVTLKEKEKKTPELSKLVGAADIWLWDDNNMNRLYARPEKTDVPERNPLKLANEMIELGMTKILWNSFEGETREVCEALKAKGFLVGKYDVYRDVLPETIKDQIIPYRVKRSINTKYWPEIVRRNKNGDYDCAWPLHGKDGKYHDQHAVCDICALELTKKNVREELEKVPYNSRFIDVQAGSELAECYDEKHPATRTESAEYIKKQEDFLSESGLVNGVEVGSEIFAAHFHYSEGMTSPCEYRAEDAGRRMTTLYYGKDIPPNIQDYMLNPVWKIPLWELVYHDCVVSYYYWGDSSNSCPELMEKRDLFCALYGLPPIYSIDVSGWEKLKYEIAESYKRATETATATAYSQMISFEYLSPDKRIQKTSFENGITVTANFSESDYITDNGVKIPSMRHIMERQ